ncbi:VOC family protein [Glaciecola petra]|uniref:VOC family protein n=1 Tax=Glaciecola petra TaxID=3075602 RepID=A0ABU2ZRX4_9ALTE|nr:VOC family protein [Aestuariibacter sp. P117]MDT0595375.1 VOC family protein [Aestuariibacter sp. P117]
MLRPFHLAIPVNDITAADCFYGGILACEKGRSAPEWIDWDFFGHQLVTHLVSDMPQSIQPNEVDAKAVPVPHFGVVLDEKNWLATAEKLRDAKIEFVIEPYIRFKGKTGEQGTFFVFDPSGNALEFKYFNDLGMLFTS